MNKNQCLEIQTFWQWHRVDAAVIKTIKYLKYKNNTGRRNLSVIYWGMILEQIITPLWHQKMY